MVDSTGEPVTCAKDGTVGRSRSRVLLCTAVAAVALGAVASEASAAKKKHSAPVVPTRGLAAQVLFERQVFKRVNQMRARKGLRKLRRSRTLARAARSHSKHQARINKMTHYGRRKEAFSTRLKRFGYPKFSRMSEVVGQRNTCETGDPQVLVKAWLRSPPHRVLLLDAKVRKMGVGVVSRKRCKQTFYTIDFGS
jgi:uncharacterized protein YkwD